jgi:predicted DNA-binding transcriptional regulator YafY
VSVPTSRLLELLELLQSMPQVTGREVAERFGVDRRTVRRDMAALQEIGVRWRATGVWPVGTGCGPASGCRP